MHAGWNRQVRRFTVLRVEEMQHFIELTNLTENHGSVASSVQLYTEELSLFSEIFYIVLLGKFFVTDSIMVALL